MKKRKFIVLSVALDYPLSNIKANVMYVSPFKYEADRGRNTLFVSNGNIYCEFINCDDRHKNTYMCCSVLKLKRFVTSTNIKDFILCRGRKENLETVQDLYNAIISCGFTRKIDCSEYYEAEADLRSDFSTRYKFEDFKFVISQDLNPRSHPGDALIEKSSWGFKIILDMLSNRRKQQVPDCIKEEIVYSANNLLEENLVDIETARFLLHAEIDFHVIGTLSKDYKVDVIMVDKNRTYIDSDKFYLYECEKEMQEAVEQYFKNELFAV